ncbi:MAG TPA: hypothetical protein VMT30_09280 [Candidatus Saccharimonadia bacterium]|nr:hypothetical protein [Candidatus Saccharimonadia bacterium]
MSAELALRTGLPGTRTEMSYQPPADLTFEEWCSAMETLQTMDRSVKWWIGDLILFGEAAYGGDASQAFPDAFSGSPFAESTLRAAAWVSAAFPRGTRVEQLTWTHHRVVAELPPIEARRLLMAALAPVVQGEPPLSTRDLIALRDRRKEDLRGRAETADGEPVETAELSWAPSLDDLTDDARRSLESRAPTGRLRSTFIAAALWAFQWAGAQDCFKPGHFEPDAQSPSTATASAADGRVRGETSGD